MKLDKILNNRDLVEKTLRLSHIRGEQQAMAYTIDYGLDKEIAIAREEIINRMELSAVSEAKAESSANSTPLEQSESGNWKKCPKCGYEMSYYHELCPKCSSPSTKDISDKEGVTAGVATTPAHQFKIVPSPRIDYCCACDSEHGYDCPKDKPEVSDWEQSFRKQFVEFVGIDRLKADAMPYEIKALIEQTLESTKNELRAELVGKMNQLKDKHGNCGCCSPLVWSDVLLVLQEKGNS